MKRIFTILLTLFLCATATAQVENSIVLDAKSFRAVQQDELTGVNIDPIGLDHSRQACARIKIKFDRMNKAQIDALEVKMRSNTDLTKQKVADYFDNVLILEMTAKPNTRFYLYSPEFGESNEVTLNLEGNCEYEMLASLNQAFSIVVESNVVGADVYLDGVFKGQTDDNKKCTISDVMIGEHKLKVVYGSASGQRVIDVNKNAISFAQNVNIAATEPQYVVFAVEPKTAAVIIDDKPQTPDEGGVVTTVLQAGTYDYSVSAKMYHSQSGTFTVAGAKVQKSVALAPAFGYLSVIGDMVDGATVFVDDENIGIAPVKSDKLASGEHSVRIVKDKYKPYSTTVTVRDSETTTLAPTLSADFATVTLTTASGATIWVNGVEKGSGSWSGELSTGTYIFEARQSGHRSAQMSQTIAPTPSRQSYAIPAPTPIVGSVDITSSPAMADITLDGKAVGTTPVKLNNILVGEHKITVSKSGYQPYSTTITVAEGRTATVSAELIKGKIYKVGDYYDENGKQGVVFEVSADGKHGKIVSMKQSATVLQWSSDSAERKRLIGADSKTDGAYNMAKVKAITGWRDKYPAFKWCADLGEGWYLPSIEELKVFTLNTAIHDAVNRTLIARGGTKLYDKGELEWYWSSTESDERYKGEFCAWGVNMKDDRTYDYSKGSSNYVRAVSAFGDSSKIESAATAVSNRKTSQLNGVTPIEIDGSLTAEQLEAKANEYYNKKDYNSAVQYLHRAALMGHAGAQCNLGVCYAKGRGVTQDYTEAVKWYRKAAEQGLASAQYNLGNGYYNGRGVTQDYYEAVKWYRKAAEQGHARAQYKLGGCYRNGYGVTQDYYEAAKWDRKAAEQGYKYAQYNLGVCYKNGDGVTQDYYEAVKWYRKAAEQGLASAQYNLGNCYYNGRGVTQDYYEAVKWYRKAAEQGYARAQYKLGVCYEYGEGVTKSITEAVKWYRKAAEQGHASAQNNLGYCYEKGRGVTKSITEAVKWYRKAAEQGHAGAQNNLGYCYEKGRGVTKSITEAVKWYKKAADKGDEKAKTSLSRLGY